MPVPFEPHRHHRVVHLLDQRGMSSRPENELAPGPFDDGRGEIGSVKVKTKLRRAALRFVARQVESDHRIGIETLPTVTAT